MRASSRLCLVRGVVGSVLLVAGGDGLAVAHAGRALHGRALKDARRGARALRGERRLLDRPLCRRRVPPRRRVRHVGLRGPGSTLEDAGGRGAEAVCVGGSRHALLRLALEDLRGVVLLLSGRTDELLGALSVPGYGVAVQHVRARGRRRALEDDGHRLLRGLTGSAAQSSVRPRVGRGLLWLALEDRRLAGVLLDGRLNERARSRSMGGTRGLGRHVGSGRSGLALKDISGAALSLCNCGDECLCGRRWALRALVAHVGP
mmetsp:Transcript_112522/g.363395  ORF Transcript_112522/g.363395 Transcript_112522/m.363395 type:complete len:261 (-) Transcript_112522:275-1057(-)